VIDGKLEICHCEVAEWLISGSADEIAYEYGKKFTKEVRGSVERYFSSIFGVGKVDTYKKLVSSKHFAREFPKALKQSVPDSEPLFLHDFIGNLIVTSINNWKQSHRTAKGNPPQLPRALWLLKMIEFLMEWKVSFK
jgi:hypothetical protein